MFVKGTAIIARREQISSQFGKDRWLTFMDTMAQMDPAFGDTIYVTSKISLESFLAFNQALVDTFFPDEEDAYTTMGLESAQWALTSGPYARLLESSQPPIEGFFKQIPSEVWSKYYDFGSMEISTRDNTVSAKITGIPIRHAYFEKTLVGYMQRAVELLGGINPKVEIVPCDEPGTLCFKLNCDGWSR